MFDSPSGPEPDESRTLVAIRRRIHSRSEIESSLLLERASGVLAPPSANFLFFLDVDTDCGAVASFGVLFGVDFAGVSGIAGVTGSFAQLRSFLFRGFIASKNSFSVEPPSVGAVFDAVDGLEGLSWVFVDSSFSF